MHTPAPWHNDGYRIYAPTNDEDKRNGRVIVEYKHVDDFNIADADLLTVAPKLLEACKRFLESSACKNGCDVDDMTCDTQFARKVVAQAEGSADEKP